MAGMKKIVESTAFAAALLWAAPIGASSTTINLTANVPYYCNVELIPAAATAPEAGLVHLGTSRELCNSPHGYRIILQHPVDMVDAAIISDASRIPLSPSGETVIWNSDQPGFEMRQLALDLGKGSGVVKSLGLRIEIKY
jgi:hypothetical protein